MKTFYIILTFMLITNFSRAQLPTFNFAKQGNVTTSMNSSNIISFKINPSDKHIFCVGTFYGTVDFDPSSSITNLTSAGGSDIFVARFDNNGGLVWAFRIGDVNDDDGLDIAIDPTWNEIYVTGGFKGTVDFDPSASSTTLVSQSTSAIKGDLFLSKFLTTGAFQWAFSVGNTSNAYSQGIQLKATEGEVYLLGMASGTVDIDPSAATYTVNTGIYNSSFLAKYSRNMTFQWGFVLGSGKVPIDAFDVEANGSFVIAGRLSYSTTPTDVQPGSGVYNLISNVTSSPTNPIIIRYNADLTVNKAIQTTMSSNNYGGYSIQKHTNGYLLTARFRGNLDVDFSTTIVNNINNPTNNDALAIIAFDNNLTSTWGHKLVSYLNGKSNFIVDETTGQIVVVGSFLGTNDFDPSAAITNGSSTSGSYSGFVAHYDLNGNYKTHYILANETSGGYGTSGSVNTIAFTQNTTNLSSSYRIGGSFMSRSGVNVDFDPSSTSVFYLGNTPSAFNAHFLASYEQQPGINTYFTTNEPHSFSSGQVLPTAFNANFKPLYFTPCTGSGGYSDEYYFTLQLSDANGSFATPTNLQARYFSAVPASMNAVLPSGIIAGTGYRLRVITDIKRYITNICMGMPNMSMNSISPPIIGTPTTAFTIINCPQNIEVNNSTITSYQASEYITTSNTINYTTGNIQYKAGKAITITPPTGGGYWQSGLGTVFEAKIEGCL